jgi:hypothetical protein
MASPRYTLRRVGATATPAQGITLANQLRPFFVGGAGTGGGGTGEDGASAYEVAVANGFVGTEAQWLASLVGPQGAAGAQGPAGPQGATGPAGPAGAAGPQGPQGVQGPAGADGADGTSVRLLGSVANFASLPGGAVQGDLWITINTGDGWVSNGAGGWSNVGPIQGPAGAAGSPGATGPQGDVGPAGPQGLQGIQGPAGAAGSPGATGPQGDVGPAGPAGPTGATGPAGPQGEQGPAGAAGATGATGPQGDVGPAGPAGPTGATGPAGPGVPTGGAAGQMLAKTSVTDFATSWVDPPAGGGGGGAVRRFYGTTAPNPADFDEWITPATGRVRRHDGTAWWEEPGIPGADGEAGPAGPAGATGPAGPAGSAGATGATGPAGADGPQGITGAGGPASVSLSANQAFSTTSLADVTNMPTLTLAANTDYIVELIGSFESAATTTGIGLALNVGGTVTRISGQVQHPVSATASGMCSQEANNAVTGATSGVRAIGVSVSLFGVWHIRMGATGGTAQLRCRSEIASSAVTLHQGMRLRAFVA